MADIPGDYYRLRDTVRRLGSADCSPEPTGAASRPLVPTERDIDRLAYTYRAEDRDAAQRHRCAL